MISVVMPIYNGEKYIFNSIDRILKIKNIDLELILINDGSTDNSSLICKKFAEKDCRVKLFEIANSGICNARNLGIKSASGEYISFIDQDDEVNENIYKILLGGFNDETDMVISGKIMQLIDFENNLIKEEKYNYSDTYLKSIDILYGILNTNRNMAFLHLWNCLYRLDIIKKNNIFFDEQFEFGHEDSLFNIQYATKCRCVHLVEGIVYKYYRRKSTSTSMKQNDNYIRDYDHYLTKTYDSIKNYNYNFDGVYFTYSIRLGINLYKQYSKGKKRATRVKQLNDIYSIAKKYDKARVNSSGNLNKFYVMYLNILIVLLKKNMYYFLDIILKIR